MATDGVSDEFIECEVRVAVLKPSGEIEEGYDFPLESYGGSVPIVGDYIAALWPHNDSEVFQVIERVHVMEFDVGKYWLILVSQVDYAPQLEKLFVLSRARSERERGYIEARSDRAWQSLMTMTKEKQLAKKEKQKRRKQTPRKRSVTKTKV